MTLGIAAEELIVAIPGLKAYTTLWADGGVNYQFHFVKQQGDYGVNLCGNNQLPIGVLQNKPGSGQAATVAGPGSTCKVMAGDTITADQALCPKNDGSGHAVPALTGDYAVAVALCGGDDGDLVTAYIVGGMAQHA